jgi:hypothetical protein
VSRIRAWAGGLGLAAWLAGAALAHAADTGPVLQWSDQASDETGFKVERKPYGGAYSEIGTTGANVTTYTDTTATPGSRYCWRVRATNAAGDSAFTNEVCARPVIPTDVGVSP